MISDIPFPPYVRVSRAIPGHVHLFPKGKLGRKFTREEEYAIRELCHARGFHLTRMACNPNYTTRDLGPGGGFRVFTTSNGGCVDCCAAIVG